MFRTGSADSSCDSRNVFEPIWLGPALTDRAPLNTVVSDAVKVIIKLLCGYIIHGFVNGIDL